MSIDATTSPALSTHITGSCISDEQLLYSMEDDNAETVWISAEELFHSNFDLVQNYEAKRKELLNSIEQQINGHFTDPPSRAKAKQKTRRPRPKRSALPQQLSSTFQLVEFGKYKCLSCKTISLSPDALIEHHFTHSTPPLRTCPITSCKKAFPRPSAVKRHLRQAHFPNQDKISCERCGKDYARSDSYKKHVCVTDTDQTNRPFQCTICSRTWISYSDMRRHRESHVYDTSCGNCGRVYANKDSLKRHRKICGKNTMRENSGG